MKKTLIIIIMSSISFSQEIITQYLIENHDTLDVFSYQIPSSYNSQDSHPLLIAFHQWGGDENSTYFTTFDEEAESRGWIFMSPYGGSSNNYNHQGAQALVKAEILWLQENYNIDKNRIYMVGGSMGGAAGMIYSNNHLNPEEPMIAATASGSGILDCERRAIEMDGNNSMIEWFGGNWDEVPFEYHRNSAIYFSDSTQSMHYNLQYIPIYLDFGASEPHRTHAEEMYEILLGYNENMWIDEDPTGSHGFSVMDETHVCDWMSQFTLFDNPDSIYINLDEPGRAYWFESQNQIDSIDFITFTAIRNLNDIQIHDFENSDSLILHIIDNELIDFSLNALISINKVGLAGNLIDDMGNNPIDINITTDGGMVEYNIDNNILWLSYFGLPPYELPILGNFILNINLSQIEGDVNQDGSCNVMDIILMINYILGTQELTDEQFNFADLNQDNSLDIFDIILAINIIIDR